MIEDEHADALLAEKRAHLLQLLDENPGAFEPLPLSFAQTRLWFLTQLEPDSSAYNIPLALRFEGPLNLTALRRSLDTIIERHEVLRTTFRLDKGEPVQIVSGKSRAPWQFLDLTSLPEEEKESESLRLRRAETQHAFDLAREFPIKVTVVKLTTDDHLLLVTVHHIAADGWSLGVLIKELSTLYDAFASERKVEIQELPIQYADFAEWQREWLQGETLEEQLGYWKASLDGAPAVLRLPTDHPRPAIQTFRGNLIKFALPEKVSREIKLLSVREGATLFMTLLTAFQTLLMRYTQEEDVSIGTPIAGRNRIETESLIGLFVNTLVLRTDFSGNPTFREALRRVKETALGAYAHQDLPFEKLVEELNPARDVSHSALFQVMFILQNAPRAASHFGDLTVTHLPSVSHTAKFDLTLQMSESDDRLYCWFEYNTDLFEEKTIQRLGRHFEVLLEGIIADPNRRLGDLPLLTAAEEQRFAEWNRTDTHYRSDCCLHELFEAQAYATPDKTAASFQRRQLTFAQLNSAANQLARFLKRRNIGPESPVAICIDRSLEMLVGLLGVLKAGAAFVPIDPLLPAERIAFLLENSRSGVLLTEERMLPSLPSSPAVRICLDSDWQRISLESPANLANTATAENAAYVIYTSGSTGQPKGVVSIHAASINRFEWMWQTFPLTSSEICCQKTSLSFVDSIWEIFGTLLKGIPLVLIDEQSVREPESLIRALEENRVTRLVLVPSLLRMLLEHPVDLCRRLPNLKYWICSGETLPLDLAKRFKRSLPGARLINLYGTSEVAADVTCYEVDKLAEFDSVPIGRPIANTSAYVLDARMEPLPIAVPGELYISGDGLARGYLGDPALTAEKFRPDRFARKPGARMFKPGDIARFREDGTIELVGRRDFQIKLRGYRMEAGEIESTLRTHPEVELAVVVLSKLSTEHQGLVCHVVARNQPVQDSATLSTKLKTFLRRKLPEYMVPGIFVFLEALPLTPSGKIDRGALQILRAQPPTTAARVLPRDDIEERLVQIWERLLGVESIGVNDNFFDLGGHSLLAVKLVSDVAEEFAQRLPLVSFFQTATVEAMAVLLRRGVQSIDWPTMVEIQSGTGGTPLFCVSTPNVNALGYRSLARHLGESQSVYGLQAQYPEDLQGEHSHAAVDELAGEYLRAMREVQSHGPYQLIGFCRGAQIAHEMAIRLDRSGESVALLGVLDTWVLENTYNKLLYVEYYYRRIKSLFALDFKETLRTIRDKLSKPRQSANEGAPRINGASFMISPGGAGPAPLNPMGEVYFPGNTFVPRVYSGEVTVFKVRRQPLNRIRDPQLGWGRVASGGVKIHIIPGSHQTILSEPHVKGLAKELKQCLSP